MDKCGNAGDGRLREGDKEDIIHSKGERWNNTVLTVSVTIAETLVPFV